MTASSRRRFLSGTAAIAAPLLLPRVARAQAPLAVPVVDSLVVRVITDSSYDTPRPATHKWVKVARSGVFARNDFRKALHSEWGLALGLESRIGDKARHVLLDAGYTAGALTNNMEVMGYDPARLQALVLSHGHYDHFGGLVGFLRKHRDRLPRELPLYVGGEDHFCIRKARSDAMGHYEDWGVLDRRELAALRVHVVHCERPTLIQEHAFTTGHIARRSFEKVQANTLVEFAHRDGVGCELPLPHARAQGRPAFDEHLHEHAMCYRIKDRGLVVIAGCGHAGIVNTVHQAQEVSGVKKIHAVLGGFHLFAAPDDYVRKTVSELRSLDPDVVVPMHCTGPGFVTAMREVLGDRLVASTTGTEFTFGA